MGLFGGGNKGSEAKSGGDVAAPAQSSAQGFSNGRLNSEDLRYGLDLAMNLGKPPENRTSDGTFRVFELPFYCKKVLWDDWLGRNQNEEFRTFTQSDMFKQASARIVKSLDMDGDGKLTPKDFQMMYDNGLQAYITKNQTSIDKYLPFAGQLVFGFAVGLGFGALARNSYKGKYWIAGIGFGVYSGFQYLAQQNFVNKELLESTFRSKVKELMDVNGDGEINREDINELVANRMQVVATKLGPGGLAPGIAGYASLGLGFLRGVRFI